MESSLSFNKNFRIVLAGVLSSQLMSTTLLAEIPRPFPVLGGQRLEGIGMMFRTSSTSSPIKF